MKTIEKDKGLKGFFSKYVTGSVLFAGLSIAGIDDCESGVLQKSARGGTTNNFSEVKARFTNSTEISGER